MKMIPGCYLLWTPCCTFLWTQGCSLLWTYLLTWLQDMENLNAALLSRIEEPAGISYFHGQTRLGEYHQKYNKSQTVITLITILQSVSFYQAQVMLGRQQGMLLGRFTSVGEHKLIFCGTPFPNTSYISQTFSTVQNCSLQVIILN